MLRFYSPRYFYCTCSPIVDEGDTIPNDSGHRLAGRFHCLRLVWRSFTLKNTHVSSTVTYRLNIAKTASGPTTRLFLVSSPSKRNLHLVEIFSLTIIRAKLKRPYLTIFCGINYFTHFKFGNRPFHWSVRLMFIVCRWSALKLVFPNVNCCKYMSSCAMNCFHVGFAFRSR